MIHAEQCYHRDIAPDNIMLLAGSNRALLLDFGAARRVIGDMTQALTVILKPGYAPVEQYAEMPGMKQGAVDRRLRAGRGGVLRDHGQDAAALGGPAAQRHLRAAGAGRGRALQRSASSPPSIVRWPCGPRSGRRPLGSCEWSSAWPTHPPRNPTPRGPCLRARRCLRGPALQRRSCPASDRACLPRQHHRPRQRIDHRIPVAPLPRRKVAARARCWASVRAW